MKSAMDRFLASPAAKRMSENDRIQAGILVLCAQSSPHKHVRSVRLSVVRRVIKGADIWNVMDDIATAASIRLHVYGAPQVK